MKHIKAHNVGFMTESTKVIKEAEFDDFDIGPQSDELERGAPIAELESEEKLAALQKARSAILDLLELDKKEKFISDNAIGSLDTARMVCDMLSESIEGR